MNCIDNSDLPLNSLNSDFIVQHYLLNLQFQEELEVCKGVTYVFIKPSLNRINNLLILDSKDLSITNVKEVTTSPTEIESFLSNTEQKKSYNSYEEWVLKSSSTNKKLDFTIEEWCIKIEIEGDQTKLVCLEYETTKEGNSLSHISDGNGGFCYITTGSLINNRSLFPYQDAPTLMSTWQLLVNISSTYTVLSTGDEQGFSTKQNEMYFYTQTVLPLSTFALAIGKWECRKIEINLNSSSSRNNTVECHHSSYPCYFDKEERGIPCNIYNSKGVDVSQMMDYLPGCYQTICQVLGRPTVQKFDFLIVPKSVAYLGLASPGLMFISPSALFGNEPMLDRLAHEISHSWFGISLGPKNWNEEWISEGFATFFEDIIQLKMSEKDETVKRQLLDLKRLNRYQILKWDCTNVDESLRCLASTGGESGATSVQNGLNRQRMVSQIPYLKGYFFLMELCSLVGVDAFLLALKKYVERFHGCLLSTEECIHFFSDQFHHQQGDEIQLLAQRWLYSYELPERFISTEQLNDNLLYVEVGRHLQFWKRRIEQVDRRKGSGVPLQFTLNSAVADQLVTLFDQLLELPVRIPSCVVRDIIDHYQPHTVNADVYHRTCELIIANRYSDGLDLVYQFLVHHSAMGAYLYGELMQTNRKQYRNVAFLAYQTLKNDMESDFSAIVLDLIS